ncbi:MAG: YlmH/Sll1252 family protein [Peptoniphilus sp.]|nr:YlmH/Sll1252 family protein [Peptoniphilus sp.]MDD7363747.1 YlmH/Sll1252 family protein [Bacillota bacterium]MDY6044132.1 YlmH/Sll1252 family protein [Peptoniphilus sp.]
MLRHILDLPEIASRNYTATASDFLDPYEQRLVESITHHFPDVEHTWMPSGEGERKIVVFSPYEGMDVENALSAFSIDSGEVLKHRDVLGSILGLGIERGKIGDIVIGEKAYVVVKREIANFIELSLKTIGRAPVRVRPVAVEDVPAIEEPWKSASAVVQSMRLDAVVRAVTHMSRDEVRARLSKNEIKVNFKTIKRAHETVSAGDLLSVRGFGRIKIFDDIGETKKGKRRFTYGILEQQ